MPSPNRHWGKPPMWQAAHLYVVTYVWREAWGGDRRGWREREKGGGQPILGGGVPCVVFRNLEHLEHVECGLYM